MQKRLDTIARIVENRLQRFFDETLSGIATSLFHRTATDDIDIEVRDLTLRGGKRLRAALVVCGYELFRPNDLADGLNNSAVVDAAAAIELLQTGLLIHDDIMDDDPTRRGGPSVHVSLSQKAGSVLSGQNLGILAGDLALAMACGLMSSLPESKAAKAANDIFTQMHLDVIRGQEQDLKAIASPEDIALHKTASYTTTGPLCIGAALAGAEEKQIFDVAAIARPLGMAFQYRDDIIGILGDPTRTGKPVGSDLINGKNTLVMMVARCRASEQTTLRLTELLKSDLSDPDRRQDAIAILRDTGALEICEQRIRTLTVEAAERLTTLCPNPEGKFFLDWLIARLVSRTA